MARSKIIKKKRQKKSGSFVFGNRVQSVIIFGLALFLFFITVLPGENLWLAIHNFILRLFGVCAVIWPVILGYASVVHAMKKNTKNFNLKIWLAVISSVFACSLFYVFSHKLVSAQTANWFEYILKCDEKIRLSAGPGIFGGMVGAFSVWAFGAVGARVSNVLILFVCLMILTRITLLQFLNIFFKPAKAIKNKIENKKTQREALKKSCIDIEIGSEDSKEFSNSNKNSTEEISEITEKFLSKIKNAPSENAEENILSRKEETDETNEKHEEIYEFPPIDFLNKSVVPKNDDITTELNTGGRILVETLKSFNVQTKITDISRGPAVTRYELQPAAGVKISRITTLADDIALNLAADGVRIEAPIPGKAAVGVEIPNKIVGIVNMRDLIESPVFKSSPGKLTVVLGRDISGKVMVADLAKMPHLLIAGSTGSGKSVCINSFIISLLYSAKPSEVKFLMIDPKVVELGVYNGIPHLLVPVVTDARKAAGALGWAVTEMLGRYKKFAQNNVRDLISYNEFVEKNPFATDSEGEVLEKMPQIVVIIDELSDLMMAAPNEVEDYICRLAQMARAAGMHLVIATQRPSVDVITGIIKANIPSRIALAVSSQIDSRTILDMSGAEKLLGRGDMLFSPAGSSKPVRVQGCYVTDKEIEKVIDYIKTSQDSEYDSNVAREIEKNAVQDNSKNSNSNDKCEDAGDPVMKEAIKCVIEAGQASTSLLQRRLRLGYARAGRLVDEMEQMGIVGPHEGSKPRRVLMNYQQFLEMTMNKEKN